MHLPSSRPFLVAITTMVAVTGAAAAVALATTSTPAGGTIHVFGDSNGQGGGGTILIVGAIGDHGTTFSANAKGKPNSNGSFVKLALKKGTILLNKSKLDTSINGAFGKAAPNPATCSVYIAASGPVTAVSGTGTYAGVSGTVHVTISIGLVQPRTKSGKCNFANNAAPIASKQFVVGSGTLSFK
jgi:hypothetical protein